MDGQRLLGACVVVGLASLTSHVRGEVLDFEAAALDSVPAGWSVAMTHEGGAPRWAVVQGEEGGQVLAQLSNDRTSQRFPLAILNSEALRNGTVSVRFKPISGSVDQAAGCKSVYRG